MADAEQRILDSVVSLEAETYKIGYQQCAVSDGCLRPQTPLDAKFSLPFTLAGALLLGQVDQSLFTPEKVADPAIQTMLGRIRVREAADLTAAYPGHWSCRVKVQLKDGRVLEQFIQDPTGSYRKPFSEEVALQKAEGLLANVYPPPGRPGGEEVIELAGSGKAAGGVRCVAGCEPSVPLKGGKDPLAGRGVSHRVGDPSTSHSAGPPPFQGRTKYINSHRISPISPMGVQVLEML